MKSGPDVFADALVPRNAFVPMARAFRHLAPDLFQSCTSTPIIDGLHRGPCPMLVFTDLWQR
jgi:hypothetical protein